MAEHKKPSGGGFTVSELEDKLKKYAPEVCFSAMFVLAAVFSLIWGGMILMWSILLIMILGVIGTLIPGKVHDGLTSAMKFVKKEKVTCIVAATIGCLVSILLPPITFALIGVVAGEGLVSHLDSKHNDPIK